MRCINCAHRETLSIDWKEYDCEIDGKDVELRDECRIAPEQLEAWEAEHGEKR